MQQTPSPKPATCKVCGAVIPGYEADLPGVRPTGKTVVLRSGRVVPVMRGTAEYFCAKCLAAMRKTTPPKGYVVK